MRKLNNKDFIIPAVLIVLFWGIVMGGFIWWINFYLNTAWAVSGVLK